MKKIVTKNEKQTRKLGEKLAKKFRGGQIICLEGDLGTGKTTLIKGIAKGLGIKKNITSPTFVLMKMYNTNPTRIKHESKRINTRISRIKRLCHVDAYRIENGQELVDIGVMEYFEDPETLVIIEWAEKVKDILCPSTGSGSRLRSTLIWIKMRYGKGENERQIFVHPIK